MGDRYRGILPKHIRDDPWGYVRNYSDGMDPALRGSAEDVLKAAEEIYRQSRRRRQRPWRTVPPKRRTRPGAVPTIGEIV